MRDASLNWPARIAGVIAAELGIEPHLLQTILQQHINELLTEASDRFDPPGIGGEREPHAGTGAPPCPGLKPWWRMFCRRRPQFGQ